jgi:hypothetical protein
MSSATKGSLHELGNKLLDRGGLADEFHDREILTRQTIGFYAEVPLSRGEVGIAIFLARICSVKVQTKVQLLRPYAL